MEESGYTVVFITAPTTKEAQELSRRLLEEKKAACVSMVHGVISSYWWQNKIETGAESLLIVKTRAALVPQVIDLVKSRHSYQVPEIIALPVIGGNPDYLKWIDESVKG